MAQTLRCDENFYLAGHEDAEKLFLSAYNSGTLHHGWIVSGIEGIGKATLCYKIARFLLSAEDGKKYDKLDISPQSPVAAQVAQRSHPDFKVLERDFIETDKKKLIKAIKDNDDGIDEMKQGLKRSSVIKVEDVRDIVSFLMKKSFNDCWRVVIVDSADDLNTSSANALLKILEEPPLKSILLLISHNPGRLLPTIRSRCAKLALRPLSEPTVASLLRRYRPELKETEVSKLAKLSGGSIGRALSYYDNGALVMYEKIKQAAIEGKRCSGAALLDLVDDVLASDESWNLFFELVARVIREILPESKDFREMYAAYEDILKIFDETERLNMDKKESALMILNKLGGGAC